MWLTPGLHRLGSTRPRAAAGFQKQTPRFAPRLWRLLELAVHICFSTSARGGCCRAAVRQRLGTRASPVAGAGLEPGSGSFPAHASRDVAGDGSAFLGVRPPRRRPWLGLASGELTSRWRISLPYFKYVLNVRFTMTRSPCAGATNVESLECAHSSFSR